MRHVALEWLVCLAALLVVDGSVAGAANLIKFCGIVKLILGFGAPKILSLLLSRP